MLKIISNNPYRILGVYANSARRDIVANKGKATAFLRTNHPVEYPLDLKGILPPLIRSLDSMNEAEAHLSIAKEQFKYVQFWFLKLTPIDDVAFNHLIAGSITSAVEKWLKRDSLSSLQNRIVCCLIKDDVGQTLELAEKLYGKFGEDYINKVDKNSTLQMTGTELLHQFIDTIGNEIGMQNLLDYELEFGEEASAYIRSHTIGPLISMISTAVEKSKKVSHKDPDARKEAGEKLMTETKDSLYQLRNILSANDPQFVMIADKLGLEILQCGIDYYNNSKDDDAAFNAMTMQKFAQSVVVGQLAKQRCDENVKILQGIIENMPPKEIITEDKNIKKELSKFVKLPDKISHAISLLNGTKAHLQSIKHKLGATNEYYLKISTQVVNNALYNIIEEVNSAQEPLANFHKLLGEMDPTLRKFYLSGTSEIASKYKEIERNVKTTLIEAWEATILMDSFDMENAFKSRYRENRSTLKSLCDNMGIPTSVPTVGLTITQPSIGPTTSTTRTPQTSSNNSGSGCMVTLLAIMGMTAMSLYSIVAILIK